MIAGEVQDLPYGARVFVVREEDFHRMMPLLNDIFPLSMGQYTVDT